MRDGKYAARQRGNQVVLFTVDGEPNSTPFDYNMGEDQAGVPATISLVDFNQKYHSRFYLVQDPNWRQPGSMSITPEMKAKISVGNVEDYKKKGKKSKEVSEGYGAKTLLDLFSTYLEVYRATGTEEAKLKAKTVGAFLIKLDGGLKEQVQARIQDSKEEEVEL